MGQAGVGQSVLGSVKFLFSDLGIFPAQKFPGKLTSIKFVIWKIKSISRGLEAGPHLEEAVACFQEATSDLRIYPACLIKEKTAIFFSILHVPKVTAVHSVTVKLH